MSIYPNPSNNNIVLELIFKSPQQTSIELSDLNGKTIISKNAGILQGKSKQILDITGIAKGSYFIRILTGTGAEVKKIIVE